MSTCEEHVTRSEHVNYQWHASVKYQWHASGAGVRGELAWQVGGELSIAWSTSTLCVHVHVHVHEHVCCPSHGFPPLSLPERLRKAMRYARGTSLTSRGARRTQSQ